MKTLGMVLVAAGVLWFILELASPGLLPAVAGSERLSLLAIGAGVILLWLGERGRQRRQWKGLGNQRKKYYD